MPTLVFAKLLTNSWQQASTFVETMAFQHINVLSSSFFSSVQMKSLIYLCKNGHKGLIWQLDSSFVILANINS